MRIYLEGGPENGSEKDVDEGATSIETGFTDPIGDRANRILKARPIVYRITARMRADGRTRIFEYDASSGEQTFHDLT